MSAATKKPTGFIFYRGVSRITGTAIVAVAIVAKSKNSKTGNLVQTHILVDNGLSPVENAKSLADEAVCGACVHRRGLGGACYVNLGQGPRAVADGVVRGIYPDATIDPIAKKALRDAVRGRVVRCGSYGDPAAIDAAIWREMLLDVASGWTGYSHQWKSGLSHDHMAFLMASADNEADRIQAKNAGYRTFRIRPASAPVLAGEFTCPASEEAGRVKTCATCKACNGGIGTRKADPVIVVHGTLAKRFTVS
jgi:hypothetical protein